MPRSLGTGLIADESMRHGRIRRDPDGKIRLTYETWLTLQYEESLSQVGAFIMAQEPGEYLIPLSLMRPAAADELRRGLAIVDPEPSDFCIYPPCSLPATRVHGEGFPLCDEHAALLQDWDDLCDPAVPERDDEQLMLVRSRAEIIPL